jgi:nucleotide-binding universal stress UspA family protein
MKKVLIPVDETKGSVDTLNVFRNMVRPPEEVILLHVSKPGGKSLMYDMLGEAEMSTFKESIKGTEYKEKMDKKAEKILSFYKEELSRDGLINVRTLVKEGNPVDEILKTAAEENAELVILGCNGKSRLQKFISGCVTKDVEKSSLVPVLVAKSEGCDKSCEKDFVLKEAKSHAG